MTIYIDETRWTKSSSVKPRTKYSHMISTNGIEDLHKFALSIGIKRHFFHNSAKIKHYDISGDQIDAAIIAGAVQVGSRELIKRSKNG